MEDWNGDKIMSKQSFKRRHVFNKPIVIIKPKRREIKIRPQQQCAELNPVKMEGTNQDEKV